MLQHLHIHNYAIISRIEVSFTEGLTIITGETGAGKSILVGALSLVLGDRADTSVLMDKEKKCLVEGSFINESQGVKDFFDQYDLDYGGEILIRREIGPTGKSRAFINDTPVNLNQLRELSTLLVDLHQQFDTLELGDNNFQREVIDALANNNLLILQYLTVYKRYLTDLKILDELKRQQVESSREFDYNFFLFNELEEAGFRDNELEDIESELKAINHSEETKAILTKVYSAFEEGDQPMVQQLKVLGNQLQVIADFNPVIAELITRMHSVQLELQDISFEIDKQNSSQFFHPEKIESMNERLSLGYKLAKKHSVRTTAELKEIQVGLSKKLERASGMEVRINELENSVKDSYETAFRMASQISSNRLNQVKSFDEKVNALLKQVGMPNARIGVQVNKKETLNLYGCDHIDFLFDANKSNRFESLRKVASGGELSRLMLCIKSLVAKSVHLPTLIFDEIDSGISGEAARQVGIILKDLAKKHQVISITHQPQIAARANHHYFVFKEKIRDRIITSIRLLNEEERVTTIATMLSGEKPTAAAFQNAREMIKT